MDFKQMMTEDELGYFLDYSDDLVWVIFQDKLPKKVKEKIDMKERTKERKKTRNTESERVRESQRQRDKTTKFLIFIIWSVKGIQSPIDVLKNMTTMQRSSLIRLCSI
jgi:hypothetical protein